MPYIGEHASKDGHIPFLKNPEISQFLQNCEYMKIPGEDEAKRISDEFIEIQPGEELPENVIGSDGSCYSEPIQKFFPSTQIGYVKISMVLIKLDKFKNLYSPKYIDPFEVAELQKNSDSITFALPGSNVKYKNAENVCDGYRLAVYENYIDKKTGFSENTSLKDMMFYLNNLLEEPLLHVKICPSCGNKIDLVFSYEKDIEKCKICGKNVYFTDALRLHEAVSDFGSTTSSVTRFMNVTEHLLIASFVKMLYEKQPELLSKTSFVIDGPLAVFGQSARVHSRLMKFYSDIKKGMENKGLNFPVILGVQKTGVLVEHAVSIGRFLKKRSIKLVDDLYRKKYITGFDNSVENFGHETYYGQDFIYKTKSGKIFVLNIPYPFARKGDKKIFSKNKSVFEYYMPYLKNALGLIETLEYELYENALIPVALAHKHASISIIPGGKVLDVFTRLSLEKK
jgi:hypothetical protein